MDAHTHTLTRPDAEIAYDVRGPLPPRGADPVLLVVGQPMTADGFADLADHLENRTVVTYDPRGLGRSRRSDGRIDHDPVTQAEDLHALIQALGGEVEMFASSGGAVTALALVAAHPEDVGVLVAHEPPLIGLLPDADRAATVNETVTRTYQESGWGAGMAAFLGMVMWQGEFTEEFVDAKPPAAAQFGLPTDDDGTRADPLLSGASSSVTAYRPDFDALRAAPTRVLIAVGEQTGQSLTGRTARATAEALGTEAIGFPGDHGGFHRGDQNNPGDPVAFAARLCEVLAAER